jgi:hypothetical protein
MTAASPSAKVEAPLDALLLVRGAAPVEAEVRRQHFPGDRSTRGDRLAGADAGRRLADQLDRRQVVEAVSESGPASIRTFASADSGTISPFCERTYRRPMSSGRGGTRVRPTSAPARCGRTC